MSLAQPSRTILVEPVKLAAPAPVPTAAADESARRPEAPAPPAEAAAGP